MYTNDATPALDQLNGADFQCNHSAHNKVAGGRLPDGSWASEAAAAYPSQLIVRLAMAFTNARTGSVLLITTTFDAQAIAPKSKPTPPAPSTVPHLPDAHKEPTEAANLHDNPPVSPVRFNLNPANSPVPSIASSQPSNLPAPTPDTSSMSWMPARRHCATPGCTFPDKHDGAHNFELNDAAARPRRPATQCIHSSDQLSDAQRRTSAASMLPAVPEEGVNRDNSDAPYTSFSGTPINALTAQISSIADAYASHNLPREAADAALAAMYEIIPNVVAPHLPPAPPPSPAPPSLSQDTADLSPIGPWMDVNASVHDALLARAGGTAFDHPASSPFTVAVDDASDVRDVFMQHATATGATNKSLYSALFCQFLPRSIARSVPIRRALRPTTKRLPPWASLGPHPRPKR